jgi:hypothetical protein
MARRVPLLRPAIAALLVLGAASAGDSPADRRRRQAQEFHRRAQERTGVLVPL